MAYVSRKTQAAFVEKYRMIGESEAFLDCMAQVSRAAKVNRPVLIIGERGTGKELVAARLHYLSTRWKEPRITINCAAFSQDLLESEIFGYEQGAFTGAGRRKPGRFEMAHGGSIFLDELANSPIQLQEKLLRVIEYGEFERVGGTETVAVNVRLIAATNQDLPKLCRLGKFKDDLLDRLSFEVITLPPLRERKEDLPMMVFNFAKQMTREMELEQIPPFSEQAMIQLMEYDWPGNVRELKNVIERAVYRCEGEVIDQIVFDPFDSPYRTALIAETGKTFTAPAGAKAGVVGGPSTSPLQAPAKETPVEAVEVDACEHLPTAVERLERKLVERMLKRHQYNQRKAAQALGVSYYQLRRIIKRLEI